MSDLLATSPRANRWLSFVTSAGLHLLVVLVLLGLGSAVREVRQEPTEGAAPIPTFVRPRAGGGGAAAPRPDVPPRKTVATATHRPPPTRPPAVMPDPVAETPEPTADPVAAGTGDGPVSGGETDAAGDGERQGAGSGLGGPGVGAGGGEGDATDPGPREIDTVVDRPVLLRKVEPEYPLMARRQRVQGLVELRCIVDRAGRVVVEDVASGSAVLTKAAVEAVTQWRYRPARFEGRNVAVRMIIPVEFSLR